MILLLLFFEFMKIACVSNITCLRIGIGMWHNRIIKYCITNYVLVVRHVKLKKSLSKFVRFFQFVDNNVAILNLISNYNIVICLTLVKRKTQ